MRSFFAGFGFGVALGLLLAPRTGVESRRQLRSKAKEVGDLILEKAESVPEAAGEFLQQTGEVAEGSGTGEPDQFPGFATKAGAGLLELLNSASREELMDMRGIGPVLADRIIEGRPFTSSEEVVERGILPPNRMAELKRKLDAA